MLLSFPQSCQNLERQWRDLLSEPLPKCLKGTEDSWLFTVLPYPDYLPWSFSSSFFIRVSRANHRHCRKPLRIHPLHPHTSTLARLESSQRCLHLWAYFRLTLNYKQHKPSSNGVIHNGGSWKGQHWGKSSLEGAGWPILPHAALFNQGTPADGTGH